MSSPLNRLSNLLSVQNSSQSIQAPSNVVMNATNCNRGRISGGPASRRQSGRGRSWRLVPNTTNDGEHQNSQQRAERRGGSARTGSSRGSVQRSRVTDQKTLDVNKSIGEAEIGTLTVETDLSQESSCQNSLRTSQQKREEVDSIDAPDSTGDQPNEARNAALSPIGSSNNPRIINHPTNKYNRSSRATGGKHKQRREARQLIEGLDGLDIDLLESLTPSNADGCTRSRHRTLSRKINLGHLVNYNYDRTQCKVTRSRNDSASGTQNDRRVQHHYSSQQNYHRYHNSNEHKFSKQQFLQANCQFVVLDGYDHTIHKVDPDWPVDWDCIEEVKFRQIGATETNCPICLEQPVAAKISRCGHIYCWACMLRYLSMIDENSVPCPICFEPIYASDLRSVVSQSYSNHTVGETITMELMCRRKGRVEVERYSVTTGIEIGDQVNELQQSRENNPHYYSQANLLIVDPVTVVVEIAQREQNELQIKMEVEVADSAEMGAGSSAGYSGEICFIEQALEMVKRRIDQLMKFAADENRSIRVEHQKMQTQKARGNIESGERSYLFYQSSDGQHIYLNPFSTKILCHEYGSLENCPHQIRAEVLQMDWISMNEAWRKRFKYLQHLPLSCEFRLIEIDFEKSNLVSKKTYNHYEEQVKSKAKERMRRLREEAKRDKLIQVEQNRKIYGIQPSLEINLDSPEQFPSVLNEHYFGLESPQDRASENCEGEDTLGNHSPDEPTDQVALSFAEIQLQEAAMVDKSIKQSNSGSWAKSANRPIDRIGQIPAQSSFAQLLVDAKTSQKKWTKSSASTSVSAHGSGVSVAQSRTDSSGVQRHLSKLASTEQCADGSDHGEDELRAPPCEFAIGDYLDLNVVSGKRRGKKKKG